MALVKDKSYLSQNQDYDDLVGDNPAMQPMAGQEPANVMEQTHYDELFADFIDNLYGKNEDAVERMLRSSKDIYKGVATVAFQILRATVTQFEHQNSEKVEPAALFGEGGMISTAVDEVYKMAQALNVPGTEDMNQYTAAQMEVMRLVGDFLEKSQDDNAVGEAQEAMIEMEEMGGGGETAAPLNSEERAALASGAAYEDQPEPAEVPPEETGEYTEPPMSEESAAPPQGLV